MDSQKPVTLEDVRQLAAQFGIGFSGGGEEDTWFDLETGPDAMFSLNGTYRKNAAGTASAFGDLVRYRDRINQAQQPGS